MGVTAQAGKVAVKVLSAPCNAQKRKRPRIEIRAQLAAQQSFNYHLGFAGAPAAKFHQREMLPAWRMISPEYF